jgi:hypothetical protein
MTNNSINMDPPKKHFKTILSGYIYPVLPLLGLVILSGLILVHILRKGAGFSTSGKILFLGLIIIGIVFILGGLWARTRSGVRMIARIFNVSDQSILEERQRLSSKILESLVVIGIFFLIFLFSLDTKIGVYNMDAARYFNDTPGYVQASSYPLSDSDFWVGQRPFTVPLFYKMIGYTLQNYTDQGEMEEVGRIQFLISVVTWTLLALSTGFLMKRWLLRFIAFAVVLMVGASLYITMWDRLMLSDSLSISLFVLFLACIISAAAIWGMKTRLTILIRILLVISLVVITVLFSFARDPNAWFLLSLGGLMLLGLLFRSIRRHQYLVEYALIMASFFAIFAVQNAMINKTVRYVTSLQHVIFYRFIPDQEKLSYLIANGMPFDPRFLSYSQLNLRESREQLLIDDPAGLLNSWITNHGKPVIYYYILTHPDYAFLDPFVDIQSLLSGNVSDYRKILSPTPLRLSILTDVFYPEISLLPFLLLVFFGITIFLAAKNRLANFSDVFVLVLLITAVPFLYLVWHSDSNDITRHALQAALQLRLASWLCLLLVVENFWAYLDKDRALPVPNAG